MADTAPRLYLVTLPGRDPAADADTLAAMLATGEIACVRLDLGPAPEEAWVAAVNALMPVCHEADVPLVVAEHHRLVGPLGLDGVHVDQSRSAIRELRKTLGSDRIVGAFGGASRHRAMTLAEQGTDYVAMGPVGETGALGDGERADHDLFAWWAEMIETPSVAEGGVGLEEARTLGEVADFVVPDPRLVWEAEDPVRVIEAFAAALG